MTEKCSWCNAILETSNGITDYKLVLQAERMANVSSVSIDVLILPPFEEKKEFCAMSCLSNWILQKAVVKYD